MSAQIAAQTARTPFRASGCFVVGADDVEVCEVHQTPRRGAQEACDLAALIANDRNAHDDLVATLRKAILILDGFPIKTPALAEFKALLAKVAP